MPPRTSFQSTRPHGRDLLQGLAHLEHAVSIHAPARGATKELARVWTMVEFQSTRPHGRDPKRWRRRRPSAGFNPRARTGRDQACVKRRYESSSFQSTRPHGRDSMRSQSLASFGPFQSTRPHGRDVCCSATTPGRSEFQSTRPHGARHDTITLTGLFVPVSIHAPARDAWAARPYFESAVSIHAPARGATTRAQSSRDEFKVSIHAPARARHLPP